MKTRNKVKLQDIIQKDYLKSDINRVFSEILIDEIMGVNTALNNLDKIKTICSKITLPIKIGERKYEKSKYTVKRKDFIPFVFCVLSYTLMFFLFGSHLLAALVGIAIGISSVQYISNKNSQLDDTYKIVVLSTIDELEIMIDEIVTEIEEFLGTMKADVDDDIKGDNLYPFDYKYKDVLIYLQNLYRNYLNAEVPKLLKMDNLEDLFECCGYKLLTYSNHNSNFFKQSFAKDLSEIKTTIPAVINKETGKCILRGLVVFPAGLD